MLPTAGQHAVGQEQLPPGIVAAQCLPTGSSRAAQSCPLRDSTRLGRDHYDGIVAAQRLPISNLTNRQALPTCCPG